MDKVEQVAFIGKIVMVEDKRYLEVWGGTRRESGATVVPK
jgi:hypothetical protein